jgi:threonylcarbamoyladenosine tRNA methylthiotransferase MtaB
VSATPPLRVSVTALGCKVNYAEMADLAGRLAAAGCDVVGAEQPADVRVLNSCTVTVAADATTRQRLRRLRRADPEAHIVLTGCSVDGNPQTYLRRDAHGRALLPDGVDAVFANAQKEEIAGHVIEIATSRAALAAAPAAATARSRAFVKIQDGCNHRCTYCSVWRARGVSRSIPAAEVREQVLRAVDSGHREIVLTGVDLGSYGRDTGDRLAGMTARVLEDVGSRARVRLSSVNTNDVTGELIELNGHPQLCSHWHMPLQSGSDAILRAMHRGYRQRQYLRVCASLRAVNADTEFTSDVMVAFPGESDADHSATLSLITETEMLAVHAFRYSPRADTSAASLAARVDDRTARRRSVEVRRAATLSGDRRRSRSIGSLQRVVWDRVEAGVAHGVGDTYLDIVATARRGVRPGGVAAVRVERLEGGRLHATLVAT